MDNGSTFAPGAPTGIPQQVIVVNSGETKSDTVIEMQKAIAELRTHMNYMGTKADIQELRADFNKSMREFQEQCASEFSQIHSQLHSMLITMWVAMIGAALTVLGIFVSITVGLPWEKIFVFLNWIKESF